MLKNSSKFLFLIVLMLGTMISISANSWLSAWMGLEINLLAFIPLITNTNNLMSSESALKYFLTQALASSVLMMAVIMSMAKTSYTLNIHYNLFSSMIVSSLLLKSGAAPFHFWFPSVMEGLSWPSALILMTWQKIAPLSLISYLIIKHILLMSIILSVIMGSLGGLNQTSLRKLMAFSSINHLGWMLAAMFYSENLWLLYFMIYSLLSMNMVLMFLLSNSLHMNQLFSSFFYSKTMKFILMMNLLSLGGLPPFMGFFPKWMIIQALTMNEQLMMMILLTTFTLITLYFYIRLCFSAFLLNYHEPNWLLSKNYNSLNMNVLMMLTFASLASLFMASIMFQMM